MLLFFFKFAKFTWRIIEKVINFIYEKEKKTMNTMIKKAAFNAASVVVGYAMGEVVCKVVVKPLKKKLKARKEQNRE